uniref:AAA family ATPase n=1 Tax=Alistipes sp. D31t1_170403_E11 TaxID=2787128 RepID=UPI00189AFEB3|nr:AAA family ATPase [Alistipes sp. D31t1_170403_E11]
MWKLTHIEAQNLCSFRHVEYTPVQGVTTLIFGHNADNESQQSNGSGKSTLIEAIAVGITGSPLRKVRTEEIINDAADECRVCLDLTNDVSGERLRIERGIFRKSASEVRCTLICRGESHEVAQPSVDAFNKYILDKLGIRRDELYASFILSKQRYSDFLSTSDREKKEIINRFSNGVLVDEAVEKLREDIEPLSRSLKASELELATLDGRIEMLAEQILEEEESRDDKQRSRAEKIATLQASVAEKRSVIRQADETLAEYQHKGKEIDGMNRQLQTIEASDIPLDECVRRVHELLRSFASKPLTDWTRVIDTKKQEIALARTEIDKWSVILGQTSQKITGAEQAYRDLLAGFDAFAAVFGQKREELTAEMSDLNGRLMAANGQMEELRKRKIALCGAIESLGAKLAGSIICPACRHEFLVSDRAFDIVAAREELTANRQTLSTLDARLQDAALEAEKVEKMQSRVRGASRTLVARKEEWEDRLSKGKRAVEAAQYEMQGYRFNLERVEERLAARTTQIGHIREKVFAEGYERIDDAMQENQRSISRIREQASAARGSIQTLEETIAEIERTSPEEVLRSLRASLQTNRSQADKVLSLKTGTERRLAALTAQEQLFMQFKSYLANTKITALGAMMNQVLADLGSDLRVNLSGYTALKNGTVREKISVTIIRDGLDAGSFGKFSEGERARVNLASIVAMQRLVNGNCDPGEGFDLMCIDEIADAMDADGLAGVFAALNRLGMTALVVSHGAVAESYPHKLLIIKENGESRIDA